jgi:hypothetical protein
MTAQTIPCPICGRAMRQTRRGATLARRGPSYICPVDEAETTQDERGHYHRAAGAIHGAGVRAWQEWELPREEQSR